MVGNWIENASIYQVYPLTFATSESGGYGNLEGFLKHMDHIIDLKPDAIWFSPFFDSPLAKGFGYNVKNYKALHPDLATMEAFETVVQRAEEAGIKVMLDLV